MSHCLEEAQVKLISIILILNKHDTSLIQTLKKVLIVGVKKISTNSL